MLWASSGVFLRPIWSSCNSDRPSCEGSGETSRCVCESTPGVPPEVTGKATLREKGRTRFLVVKRKQLERLSVALQPSQQWPKLQCSAAQSTDGNVSDFRRNVITLRRFRMEFGMDVDDEYFTAHTQKPTCLQFSMQLALAIASGDHWKLVSPLFPSSLRTPRTCLTPFALQLSPIAQEAEETHSECSPDHTIHRFFLLQKISSSVLPGLIQILTKAGKFKKWSHRTLHSRMCTVAEFPTKHKFANCTMYFGDPRDNGYTFCLLGHPQIFTRTNKNRKGGREREGRRHNDWETKKKNRNARKIENLEPSPKEAETQLARDEFEGHKLRTFAQKIKLKCKKV